MTDNFPSFVIFNIGEMSTTCLIGEKSVGEK